MFLQNLQWNTTDLFRAVEIALVLIAFWLLQRESTKANVLGSVLTPIFPGCIVRHNSAAYRREAQFGYGI
jgi:hypothetical protein